MHLAIAIGALTFASASLAFVIWSGRKTDQLHRETMRNYKSAAQNYAQAAANWDRVAEINKGAAADWAAVQQARVLLRKPAA